MTGDRFHQVTSQSKPASKKQIWKYSLVWFDGQKFVKPCKSLRAVNRALNHFMKFERITEIKISKIPEEQSKSKQG